MKTDFKPTIKISILKDGDKFAYMEYQNGNDPLVYNNVYGSTGFWDIADVCQSIIKDYQGTAIEVTINI